jgi:hypothetical protein
MPLTTAKIADAHPAKSIGKKCQQSPRPLEGSWPSARLPFGIPSGVLLSAKLASHGPIPNLAREGTHM